MKKNQLFLLLLAGIFTISLVNAQTSNLRQIIPGNFTSQVIWIPDHEHLNSPCVVQHLPRKRSVSMRGSRMPICTQAHRERVIS